MIRRFFITLLFISFTREILDPRPTFGLCNEYGCAPGYLLCNEFGCPSPDQIIIQQRSPSVVPKDLYGDVMKILIEQSIKQSINQPPVPTNCVRTSKGLFCYLNVWRTSNPNLKRVSFKMEDGRVYENYYIDCMKRIISGRLGWSQKFDDNTAYSYACTNYN